MNRKEIPSENIEIYCMLYQIETALRELIIELMEITAGQKWYITYLPGDVLEKYRKAKDYERNIKWSHSTPMHPIYYIDFTDLEKIITRNDNWQNAFKNIFKSKDFIKNVQKELESIRNKVAHNRKANVNDVKLTKVALIKISECIGGAEFEILVNKSTSESDIINHVRYLGKEALDTYQLCIECKKINELKFWSNIKKQWWFDESYLGVNIDSIICYFMLVEQYMKIPRARGVGHVLEKWIKANNIYDKYIDAKIELDKIKE